MSLVSSLSDVISVIVSYARQAVSLVIIQSYSKRSIHYQNFILQVLLNIWWRDVKRLKGELSKVIFTPYKHSMWAPCVTRQMSNRESSSSHTPHNSPWQTKLLRAHLAGYSNQNVERFPFHRYTGHGFSISSFCKMNFWKFILLF
jgi:hypothetical protein